MFQPGIHVCYINEWPKASSNNTYLLSPCLLDNYMPPCWSICVSINWQIFAFFFHKKNPEKLDAETIQYYQIYSSNPQFSVAT